MRNRVQNNQPTNASSVGARGRSGASGSAYAVSASSAAVSKGSYLSLPTQRTTTKRSRVRLGQKKPSRTLTKGKKPVSSAAGDIAQALQLHGNLRAVPGHIDAGPTADTPEIGTRTLPPSGASITITDLISEAPSSDSAREVESIPAAVGVIGQHQLHIDDEDNDDDDDDDVIDYHGEGHTNIGSSGGSISGSDDLQEEDNDEDDDEYSVAQAYASERDDPRNEVVAKRTRHVKKGNKNRTGQSQNIQQQQQQQQQQHQHLPLSFTASTQQLIGQDKHAKLWQDIAQMQQESDGTAMALKRKTKKLRLAQTKASELGKRHQMDRRRVERLLHRVAFLEKSNMGTTSELQRAQQDLHAERQAYSVLVEESKAAAKQAQESHRQVSNEVVAKESLRLALEEQATLLQTKLDTNHANKVKIDAKQAAAKDEQVQIQKRMQVQLDMMRAEVERLSLQKEEVSRHLWHASDEAKRLKANVAQLEEQAEQSSKQSKDVQVGLKQSKETIKTANAQVTAEHARADKLQKQLNQQCEVLAQHQHELRKLEENTTQQLSEKDKTVKQYATEATAAKILCDEIRAEMTKQTSQAEAHAQTLRQAAQVLQENHLKDAVKLEKELKAAQAAKTSAEARYNTLETETKEIRRQHKISSAQTRQDRQRIKVLENDLAKTREETSKLKKTELEHLSARARTEAALNALQAVRDRDMDAMRSEVALVKTESYSERVAIETAKLAAETSLQDVKEELKLAVRRAEDITKDLDTLKNTYKNSKETWNTQETDLRMLLDSAQSRLAELEGCRSQQLEDIEKELGDKTALCEEMTKEKAGLLHDCGRMNGELAEARLERKQIDTKLSESHEQVNELMEELDQAKLLAKRASNGLTTHQEKTTEQIQEHIQARKDLRGVIDELKGEVKQAQRTAAEQVMAFGKDAEQLRVQVSELKQSKQELEQSVEAHKKSVKERERKEDAMDKELSSLHQKYQVDTETLQLQVDRIRTELAGAEQQRREMEASIADSERLSNKLNEMRASLIERDQGLNQTQKELLAAKAELEEECEKVNGLRKEILIRKQDYQNVTSELATLKADRAGMERDTRVREARLNKEIAEAKHLAQSKQGDVERSNHMLQQVQRKFERVQEAANQTVKNLMEEANKSQEAYEQDLALLRNEIRTQHNKFLDLKNDMAKETNALRTERGVLEERVDGLERRRDELAVDKSKLAEEMERKATETDAVAEELENATQAVDGLERRLAQKEVTLGNLEKQLQAERDSKHEVRRALAEQEAQTQHNLETERELNAKLKADLQAVKRDKDWVQNDSNIKLSALQRQASNLKGDLQRKTEEFTASQLRLQEAQEQAHAVEATLSKQVLEMRETQRTEIDARQTMLDKVRRDAAASVVRVTQLDGQVEEYQTRLREAEVKLEEVEEYSANRRDAALNMGKRVKVLEQAKRKLDAEIKKLKGESGAGAGGGSGGESAKALEEALDERDKTIAALRGAHAQETERLRGQIDTLRDTVAGVPSNSSNGVSDAGGDGGSGGVHDNTSANAAQHHQQQQQQQHGSTRSSFEGRLRAVQTVARTYFDATQESPQARRPPPPQADAATGERRRRSNSGSSIGVDSRPLPRAPPPISLQQAQTSSSSSSSSSLSTDLMDRTSEFLEQRRGSAATRAAASLAQQQQQRGLMPDGISMAEADQRASQLQQSAAAHTSSNNNSSINSSSVVVVSSLSTNGDSSCSNNSERLLPYVNSARGGARG